MTLDPKSRQSFARMVGGVAGAMDQGEANTLREGKNGSMTSAPSRKYLNQAKTLISESMPRIIPPQNQQPTQKMVFHHNETEEYPIDISKYIKRENIKPKPKIESDQVDIIKKALEPINLQLEKLCMLIGLVYQELSKQSIEHKKDDYPNTPEYVRDMVADLNEPVENVDNEIKKLESTLKNRPKPPLPIEADQNDEDEMNIDGVE